MPSPDTGNSKIKPLREQITKPPVNPKMSDSPKPRFQHYQGAPTKHVQALPIVEVPELEVQ